MCLILRSSADPSKAVAGQFSLVAGLAADQVQVGSTHLQDSRHQTNLSQSLHLHITNAHQSNAELPLHRSLRLRETEFDIIVPIVVLELFGTRLL